MLDYVAGKDRDKSLLLLSLRMVPSSGDPKIVPILLGAMKDPSPLVRSSVADALQHVSSQEGVQTLVAATGDDYRLVRVRAASSLAGYPVLDLSDGRRRALTRPIRSILLRLLPDQTNGHRTII